MREESVPNKPGTPEPRIYVGAYALCLDSRGRILLCRLDARCIEAGYWTLPGGGLTWGEPPEGAVTRELQEETGLGPDEIRLSGHVFSEVYPNTDNGLGNPIHHIGLLYRMHGLTGRLQPETAGTTDQCAWFSRAEAGNLPLTALGRFALDVAWTQGAAPGQSEG